MRSLIRRKCSLERVLCCLFPKRAKEREAEIIRMTSIVFLRAQFEKHILSLKKESCLSFAPAPILQSTFLSPSLLLRGRGESRASLVSFKPPSSFLFPSLFSLPLLALTTGFWSKCVARETGKEKEVVSAAAAASAPKPASAPPFCRLSLLPLIKKRFGSQSRKNKCIEQKKREKERER